MKKTLFIFVEGSIDKKFFEKKIIPHFKNKYECTIITYAETKEKWNYLKRYLNSIYSMGADYIIIIDKNDAKCVSERKDKLLQKVKSSTLELKNIFVVEKEIESWLLAGVNQKLSQELGIKSFSTTDDITKEQFRSLIGNRSYIETINKILENYDLDTAKNKNRSFKYFCSKFSI